MSSRDQKSESQKEMKTIYAPEKQHVEKFKRVWKWDPNNGTLCVQFHSPKNIIAVLAVPTYYAHDIVEERNRHIQTREVDYNQGFC